MIVHVMLHMIAVECVVVPLMVDAQIVKTKALLLAGMVHVQHQLMLAQNNLRLKLQEFAQREQLFMMLLL
jgi:hypothetical protein